MSILNFLYHTAPGRLLLKPLCSRQLSAACGFFMDSRASCFLIRPFAAKNQIDTSLFRMENVHTFNDFFSRQIDPAYRPVDRTPSHLIAPCDGLLSVYPITRGLVIPVKQTRFSIERLLHSRSLAGRYEGGYCFVFRLCVNHYHRYCFAESGVLSPRRFLPGILHTVRPVALEKYPVFTENSREYVLIRTKNYGALLQMEVGALLVGKICNYPAASAVRGAEKGKFLYGGSTIILLVEPGKIQPPSHLLAASARREEVPVVMGQKIACCARASCLP